MAEIGSVSAALAALHADDPKTGRLAASAFESLTWGEGLESVTQISLQEFLWYQLPAKSPAPREERRATAEALGRLFERLDLGRYAAICASETTRAVMAAYERGPHAGLAAYRKALSRSGVEPPDLPELSWGQVMGGDEAAAYYATAGALELAQAAGMFSVGRRGWRTAQRQVATDVLTRPRAALGGVNWLEKVHAERLHGWARAGGATRGHLIDSLLDRLRAAPSVPDQAARVLEPARRLLDEAADGIVLTRVGHLPRALVVAMNDAYEYYDLPGYRPRGEHDVLPLTELRELLRGAGLIRRIGGRLVLSGRGRRLQRDTPGLWRAVTGRLIVGEDLAAAVAEIVLLTLSAGRPIGDERLGQIVVRAVAEEGWHDPRTHDVPDAAAVAQARAAVRHRLQSLRLLRSDTAGGPYRLTTAGQAAALAALGARAPRPRTGTGA